MGYYINVGNAGFQSSRNGEYVDKSGLISIVNGTLFTEKKFSCVTRCRRFGKSMAAKMLCAYYVVGISYDRGSKRHECRIKQIRGTGL